MRAFKLALAVGLGLAVAASAAGAAEYKMTTFVPEGTASWKLYPQDFTEKVKMVTDGEIIIKPFGSGVLAGVFEGQKAVLDGRADMSYHYPAFEVNALPASSFISDVPGGMGSDAKLAWLLAGGGYELWQEYRASQGLHGMFCGLIGSEVFAHSHKAVKSLADLKGYKYRTAGANTWVMERVGAAPTLVPGPDTFPILERKGIDAAEYLDPYGNFQLGFHKIAKYVILPGIQAPGGNYEVLMKKATWDGWSDTNRQKVQLACDSNLVRAFAFLQHHNVQAVKEMDASGRNEIVELDREVIDAIRKAGREWVDEKIKEENAKGNPWMEKFAKSYYGFLETWTKYSSFQVIDRQ